MVLQSVAWTRMLIANSRTDTLPTALVKTFDGKHPCKMCHQIREGREEERHEASLVSGHHAPRLWLALSVMSVPPPVARDRALEGSISSPPADFVGIPPDPPPRVA